MKKIIIFTFVAMLFMACDKLEPVNNYYIADTLTNGSDPVEPGQIVKKVLAIDFTGIRCPNCPRAHEKLHQLTGVYGERFISVAIHCGNLAFPIESQGYKIDLRTEDGEKIYTEFGSAPQPAGSIDNFSKAGLSALDSWDDKTSAAMQKEAKIGVSINKTLTGNKLNIKVKLNSEEDISSNFKLSVWLIEDNIVTRQADGDEPGEGVIENYKQMHVFRDALTDAFGDAVKASSKEDNTVTMEYSTTLDSKWKVENLHIVAFVFDPDNAENPNVVLNAEQIDVK